MLDITERCSGYDEVHWSNFVDQNLTSENHKRYGVSVRVENAGVHIDLNSKSGRNKSFAKVS